MFRCPLGMLLLCIYQCHCHTEIATVTFGSRNRQEPALLFAPAQPGDRDTAPGGVRGMCTCQSELAPKFSRTETGVEENRAKTANSDYSQAHRIVLMSVLIKIFQGQFELWLLADRYVLFPFWDLQLPANHQTVFSQLWTREVLPEAPCICCIVYNTLKPSLMLFIKKPQLLESPECSALMYFLAV